MRLSLQTVRFDLLEIKLKFKALPTKEPRHRKLARLNRYLIAGITDALRVSVSESFRRCN
jgi:hypothetical protein